MDADQVGDQRVVVRIDGKSHAGTYREIADLVSSLARSEAGDVRAPSARKARAAARRQTAGITRRLQIETPLQLDAPPAVIEDRMLRDLRDVYSRSLVAAMTEPNKKLIEAENMKAIETALEMLL